MVMRLSKADGDIEIDDITDLTVGAEWDDGVAMRGAVKGWLNRKKGVNLDLIVVAFQNSAPVRYAGFGNNDPFKDGSVLHSGDAKNGKASGDDESVDIHFSRLNPSANIDKFVCFVAAFQVGSDFNKAENISFNIYNKSTGTAVQVADIMPALNQTGNAHRVCTIVRRAHGWVM